MANAATNTMTTEELLAPLASMEDLSVLMTPMSTPGPSPRTRARWSHRSSTGSQYEPYIPSPLANSQNQSTVPKITSFDNLSYFSLNGVKTFSATGDKKI